MKKQIHMNFLWIIINVEYYCIVYIVYIFLRINITPKNNSRQFWWTNGSGQFEKIIIYHAHAFLLLPACYVPYNISEGVRGTWGRGEEGTSQPKFCLTKSKKILFSRFFKIFSNVHLTKIKFLLPSLYNIDL